MIEESRQRSSWTETIGTIKSSLKFFALALLMVEALIGLLAVHPSANIAELSYLAVIMFVLVVMMVTILTYKVPKNLIAETPADLDAIVSRISNRQKTIVQKQKAKREFELRLAVVNIPELKPLPEGTIIRRKVKT